MKICCISSYKRISLGFCQEHKHSKHTERIKKPVDYIHSPESEKIDCDKYQNNKMQNDSEQWFFPESFYHDEEIEDMKEQSKRNEQF